MSEKIEDGGPAFPKPLDPYPNLQDKSTALSAGAAGMSLRDWFAGQALAGLAEDWPSRENIKNAARRAYELADAMLEARQP